MKTVFKLVLAATISLASFTASAEWVAYASSADANGWGASLDRQTAINRALFECSKRTSYWNTCYITNVIWR